MREFLMFIAALTVSLVIIMAAGAFLDRVAGPKEDKASDVMRSCADTGMYLHKGYAISCRVLINGSHEQQGMKI